LSGSWRMVKASVTVIAVEKAEEGLNSKERGKIRKGRFFNFLPARGKKKKSPVSANFGSFWGERRLLVPSNW